MAKRKRKSKKKQLDTEQVRQVASGRWLDILADVGNIPRDILDGRHHPCPHCGGKDRFRLIDEDMGAVLCNGCFNESNGDGFAAVQWGKGIEFPDALTEVAKYLGVEPTAGEPARPKADPAEHLDWRPWNDLLIAGWVRTKPPITVGAVKAAGGQIARYRGQFTVVAIPIWGQQLDAADPVGWAMMNITGGSLPRFGRDGKVVEQIQKPKTTYGSKAGVIGDPGRLRTATTAWKVEGISDVLTWLSMPNTPTDHAAITNSFGCGEKPKPWIIKLFAGKSGRVLHDADKPGQDGAVAWSLSIAASASECRNVQLPHPVADTKGQDLRDWVVDGGTFGKLAELAAETESISAEQLAEWKAAKPTRKKPTVTLETVDEPHETDLGNAKRLAALHGNYFRYVVAWKKWLKFDGTRWKPNRLGEIQKAAKDTVSKLWYEVAGTDDRDERDRLLAWAKKSESAAAIDNMIRLAQTEADIPTTPEQFDTHSWLLNCENGTLDLRTGELRPHSQEDYLTQIVPIAFTASATAPRWEQFLSEVFLGNHDLIRFVQRLFGYCLSGSTRDHVLPILYGRGANGKSTLVEVFFSVLGPNYSMKGTHDFLMAKQGGHPTEKADLFGKRFVGCVETEEDKRLAESFVKELTGGDRIRARRMREDFWEFTATHKVWLATNHKPRIKGTNEGIWRRVCLIPFEASFEGEAGDASLPEKLHEELPGILAWAVAGCLEWQRTGLDRPAEVRVATREYRQDEDLIAKFVDECCTLDSNDSVGATDLYRAFREWSGSRVSQTAFGKSLTDRGFDRASPAGRVLYIRVGLRPEFTAKEK